MLTQKDLDEIEELTRKIVKDEIKHLPSKDDFYTRMDKLMHKLNSIGEEVTVVSSYKDQIEDHETRIGKIEQTINLPT